MSTGITLGFLYDERENPVLFFGFWSLTHQQFLSTCVICFLFHISFFVFVLFCLLFSGRARVLVLLYYHFTCCLILDFTVLFSSLAYSVSQQYSY